MHIKIKLEWLWNFIIDEFAQLYFWRYKYYTKNISSVVITSNMYTTDLQDILKP